MGFALHVILVFVREMEDNGCPVQEASQAPLFMSTRLSKLEPKDNGDFAKEMQREKPERRKFCQFGFLAIASSAFRSRGKKETDAESNLTVRDCNNSSIKPA